MTAGGTKQIFSIKFFDQISRTGKRVDIMPDCFGGHSKTYESFGADTIEFLVKSSNKGMPSKAGTFRT